MWAISKHAKARLGCGGEGHIPTAVGLHGVYIIMRCIGQLHKNVCGLTAMECVFYGPAIVWNHRRM